MKNIKKYKTMKAILKRLLFIPTILIFGCFSIPISTICLMHWILTGKPNVFDWWDSIGYIIAKKLLFKD